MRSWLYLALDESTITQLQNEISTVIPTDWKRETNPHVTILPGFSIPSSNTDAAMSELNEIVDSISIPSVSVVDFHFYPALDDREQTYVVSLKVDVDLDPIQETVVACVDKHDGEILYEYQDVTPHITLFKSGDSVDPSKTAL